MVQTKELEFIPPKKRREPKKEHIKNNNVDHVKLQVAKHLFTPNFELEYRVSVIFRVKLTTLELKKIKKT